MLYYRLGVSVINLLIRSRNTLYYKLQREREREMLYLTTHSTHFIYGYMASDMVKDHSDSEKGKPAAAT